MEKTFRVGQGYDVHAFAPNRKLILGGIEIPHDRGLLGHSDADVLLHALTDAILGALSWGDIGQWFPDSNPSYSGADSKELLRAVWSKAKREGWELLNCDCSILAEKPKLASFIPAMKQSVANVLSVAPEQVGIKAGTNEKLGFIGREEGIAAVAVALLTKQA